MVGSEKRTALRYIMYCSAVWKMMGGERSEPGAGWVVELSEPAGSGVLVESCVLVEPAKPCVGAEAEAEEEEEEEVVVLLNRRGRSGS